MADSSIQKRTFRVELRNGLHLRPCSMIAECANNFTSDIKLMVNNLILDAKSPFDLMSMGTNAEYGSEVTLEASGDDSLEAMEAIGLLFETGFPIDGASPG